MKNTIICILFNLVFCYGFGQKNVIYDKLPVYKNTVKVIIEHEPIFQNSSQKVSATLENLSSKRIRFRGFYFANTKCGEQIIQHFGSGDGIILLPFQKLEINSKNNENNLSFNIQNKVSSICLNELSTTPNTSAITDASYKIVFLEDMDEREEAEKIVAKLDCPIPSKMEFEAVCFSGYDREPIQGNKLSFSFQEHLWKMSCADPENDSQALAKAKIQKMWNQNRIKFICSGYAGVLSSGSNISLFSIETGFSTFVIDAVNKWDLNLNFIDENTNGTVMDFLISEIKRYSEMNNDFSGKIKEYQEIYDYLKRFEVKHASEL